MLITFSAIFNTLTMHFAPTFYLCAPHESYGSLSIQIRHLIFLMTAQRVLRDVRTKCLHIIQYILVSTL